VITLENSALSVDVLHPLEDRERLGPRFCTGGYVYQVHDRRHGPLLSGPEYPSARPSVINGQGMPDVFQHTLYLDPEEVPERRLVIGVGLVENSARLTARQSHFDSPVEEYCRWEIESSSAAVRMRTRQELHPWRLELHRSVELARRTVTLMTGLANTGAAELPYRWFAHPFFPLPPAFRCGRFPDGCSLEPNPGFRFDAAGHLLMVAEADWARGVFALARETGGKAPFRVAQFHGLVGAVEVHCSFAPAKLAFWANDRTFSFEPFVQGSLAPGESTRWEISYRFGGSA
jgi:hypothetical protein